jgi:hypothetical protein
LQQLGEIKTKFEVEKKEAVMKEQQEKERAVAEERNRKQQIIIGSVIGVNLKR